MRTLSRFSVLFCFWLMASDAALAEYQVTTQREAGTITVLDDGKPIVTYGYRDKSVRRPYFANVIAPNRVQVTRSFPPREGIDPTDHDTMHPGIWMAFGDISGGDFWRGKAEVRHVRFVEEPVATPNRVHFAVENAYINDGQTICFERGEYEIRRRPNGHLFLFDSTFRAVQRADFGDQQEMGLGIRLATPLRVRGGTGRIVDSEGRVNEAQTWGKRADWCDYSGIIDGHRTGAMLMPDPRNFRPSRFHSRDYGFTVANPFADHDFGQGKENHTVISPGMRLHMRFGVFVYSTQDQAAIDPHAIYRDFLTTLGIPDKPSGEPWRRHTIDDGSQGADGVRVADINADGLPDLTTGWEEGGEVRVYVNPGPQKSRERWPSVVVGNVPSVEDAVFADINSDGRLDVVACCEGRERSVYVCFAPGTDAERFDSGAWKTMPFPSVAKARQWMFAMPLQIDGTNGVDLVLGSKGPQARVGWLQAPRRPSDLEAWKWHSICDAGWIMSLRHRDVDHDGDQDLLISDRTHQMAGCWWLENPGVGSMLSEPWKRHPICGQDREVMFIDVADLDGDGRDDVLSAVRQDDIVVARRTATNDPRWELSSIPMPRGVGTGKAVAVGDVQGDGTADVIVTCENARGVSGVFWMQRTGGDGWLAHDISGADRGVKYDRMELMDLDADGDLDVVTCEERDNLGVIWYENPWR